MPRNYSDEYKSTLSSVNSPEIPYVLLEIHHADLTEPVRVINDTQDLTSNGKLYIGCPFRALMPDDFENQLPKSSIAIDNVSKDLMYWIEQSGGAKGSTVRFMQVMRSRPDLIEWEITMNLYNISCTPKEITGELGYENLFTKPAVSMQYRNSNSPGIF